MGAEMHSGTSPERSIRSRRVSVRLRVRPHRRFVALSMSSFRQILAQHPHVLLLDAASAQVQIGWFRNGKDTVWRTSETEAGTGVFVGIAQLEVDLKCTDAFVFCEGPGSILGIRTVAVALRTWTMLKPSPIYSYQSLSLVAASLNRPEVNVIADARRESWHCFNARTGLRRVPVAELSGELVTPAHFRHWSTLPTATTTVPYELKDLWPQVMDCDLLHECEAPDAFLHEEPSYVTWTPQIHRAPSSS